MDHAPIRIGVMDSVFPVGPCCRDACPWRTIKTCCVQAFVVSYFLTTLLQYAQ